MLSLDVIASYVNTFCIAINAVIPASDVRTCGKTTHDLFTPVLAVMCPSVPRCHDTTLKVCHRHIFSLIQLLYTYVRTYVHMWMVSVFIIFLAIIMAHFRN